MRVWLHIGFHKTGSSAIQSFLLNSRSELLEEGLDYPMPLCGYDSHGEAAWCFLGERAGWRNKDYDPILVRDYFRKKLTNSNGRDFVVSSEDFSLMPRPQVEELCEWFKGYDLRVIAYVRDPLDQAVSRYHHGVLNGRTKEAFKDFLENAIPSFGEFSRILDLWASIVGPEKIRVRQYSTNAAADFCYALGYESNAPTVAKRVGAGVHPWLSNSYRGLPDTPEGQAAKDNS
ncbi:sulfotransferase domain-containing protein [Ruegeria sp.]|uniref:sulfotransferase domain-containing protein n=1 Tax=Ruegeria sp. TaxID=1879320 RepID=UPI003B59BA7F